MNKRTYAIKKNKVNEYNVLFRIVAVGLIIIFLSSIFILYANQGEIEVILNDVEDAFNFNELDYHEILYYFKTDTGPFGENNRFLIIKLDEECQNDIEIICEQQEQFYLAPIKSEIQTWLNNEISTFNISKSVPKLSNGYYAFYSKEIKKMLSLEEVNSCIYGENLTSMHRYIFMQYSNEDGILYIFEYS